MAKLDGMSIAQLRKAIEKKEALIGKLMVDREKLAGGIADIDKRLALLVGEGTSSAAGAAGSAPKRATRTKASAGTTGAKRGRKATLTTAILEVLTEASEPMDVSGISEALKNRRFKTRSKNLPNLVREALTRVEGIKRVSRGVYTAS